MHSPSLSIPPAPHARGGPLLPVQHQQQPRARSEPPTKVCHSYRPYTQSLSLTAAAAPHMHSPHASGATRTPRYSRRMITPARCCGPCALPLRTSCVHLDDVNNTLRCSAHRLVGTACALPNTYKSRGLVWLVKHTPCCMAQEGHTRGQPDRHVHSTPLDKRGRSKTTAAMPAWLSTQHLVSSKQQERPPGALPRPRCRTPWHPTT